MTIPFHTSRGTINLLALRREDMTAEIFAEALAKQNRYGGRTPEPWSVASHSVLVEGLCPPEYRPWALLHDAHEVFLGDFMTPAVDLICQTNGATMVDVAIHNTKGVLDRQIGTAWGVAVVAMAEPLRRADYIAYLAEVWTFMGIRPDQKFGAADTDLLDLAMSRLRELAPFHQWRDAAALWLDRVDFHAKLGALAPPRSPDPSSAVLAG